MTTHVGLSWEERVKGRRGGRRGGEERRREGEEEEKRGVEVCDLCFIFLHADTN